MSFVYTPGTAVAGTILGAAENVAVMGSSAVTNTGATTINGDLDLYPGAAITGAGAVSQTGAMHDSDAVAQFAHNDAIAAYNILTGLSSSDNLSGQDLGGLTLVAGDYNFNASAQLTGTLTLNFEGASNEDIVIQIGSALTTAGGSKVVVENGNSTDGVFFQVGSSATLGAGTAFAGNILAGQSITLDTGAQILCGRAIALNAAVTMDTNSISNSCFGSGNEGSGVNDFNSMGFSGGDFTSLGYTGGGFDGISPLVSSTPEPSTFPLLGFGLLGILWFAARRRILKHMAVGGAAMVLFIPSSSQASTIYVDDTFSDGSRTNQNLPASADWYAAKVTAGLTVSGGQLVLNTASGNDGLLAYFTPTTASLGIGDSLQISFDFSLEGTLAPQDRAFGVFFYNSGGNRLTNDDTSGFNSALFNGYTGYGITYDPDSANPARYRTTERNLTANNLFSATPNVALGSAAASAILTAGQTYTGSLTVTRNAASVSVQGNINGALISNIDSSSNYTAFDTVAFLATTSDIPQFTLDNIVVTETSAAPEPSTLALVGCGLLCLGVSARRRTHTR